MTCTTLMEFEVGVPIAPVDFSVYFKSPAGRPLTYSLAGIAPAGLTINSTTGVLSGAPTTTGIYDNVNIFVADDNRKHVLSNVFNMGVFTVEENTVTITVTNNVFFVQDSFDMRFKRY